MDSGAGGGGGATPIHVPYRHLRNAEMELVSLNGSPRAGEGPPKDPHRDADGARQAGGAVTSRTKLVLACMVAAGVQFGWALQLSLLTPYIQVKDPLLRSLLHRSRSLPLWLPIWRPLSSSHSG